MRWRAIRNAARRLGNDVAAVDVDLGAQSLEAHQVQIDGSRADGATARHGDARDTHARHQRTQYQRRRTHCLHDFVFRLRIAQVPARYRRPMMRSPMSQFDLSAHGGK